MLTHYPIAPPEEQVEQLDTDDEHGDTESVQFDTEDAQLGSDCQQRKTTDEHEKYSPDEMLLGQLVLFLLFALAVLLQWLAS